MNDIIVNEIADLSLINSNNSNLSYIFNEITNNSQYPKYHKNNELCFVLFSNQQKYIIINKNDNINSDDENFRKNTINNLNMSAKVLNSFKKKYPDLFKDLKGIKIESFYRKSNKSKNYELIKFDDNNNILNTDYVIFVNIHSTEVWVPLKINLTMSSIYKIDINSILKLDRLIRKNQLKKVIIKSVIAIFNNICYQKDKELSNQKIYILNDFLHCHYLISLFNMNFLSFNSFDWDSQTSNNFNIEINVSVSFINLEEYFFKIIKNKISKISIKRVNIMWNDFIELKNYNEFKNNQNFEKEFRIFQNEIRKLVFNSSKKNGCYLIFSKKNFSDYKNDYYSYSSFTDNKKKEKLLNLIILPQVDEKLNEKKKSFDKIDETNIFVKNNNLDLNSNSSITSKDKKKKKFKSNKHFEESPLDEPLVKSNIKNNEKETKYDENIEIKKVNKKKSESKNVLNSLEEDKYKNVTQITKSIYKDYEKEPFSNEIDLDDVKNISKGDDDCNNLCKILKEIREPSTYLNLGNQIQNLINVKNFNEVLLISDFLKCEKNELDKFYLPKIKVSDFMFSQIKDEKYSKKNASLQSPFSFTIEILLVSLILIIILSILGLIIKFP